MNRFEHTNNRHRQQGVALVVSLVLLIALTIIGVATLTGTRLNEKIAGNAQQRAISFEAAESAINTVWTPSALLDSLNLIPADQFNDPDPVAAPVVLDFDQTNSFGTSVAIDAEVAVQFCGETTLTLGSSLSADESKVRLVGATFDVHGTSLIDGSKARADHVRRGYIVRPETGRTGKCVSPGV